MILQALQESRLEALASFSSTELLLQTGYCPVMGRSVAVCTRKGDFFGHCPEDELAFAKSTSDAKFFTYRPETLDRLVPFTEVLGGPIKSDVLEGGMTFNIEPAIYLNGVGDMRHCDVVACTHDGAEVLTDF